MDRTRAGPPTVRMHPHRGVGVVYALVTTTVLGLVLAGITANVGGGRLGTAAVIAVVGLVVAAFLAVATAAMLLPALTVTAHGVRGRMARGNTVEAGWDEVTIDVDDDAAPGTLRLDLGGGSLSVSGRAWAGFRDFVILLGGTPAAAARLTPPARREVTRLLEIAGWPEGS